MSTSVSKDLARVPLFATLGDKDRDFLATNLDPMDFPAGERLITEGRTNHTFFVLREGEVEVLVRDRPPRVLGPGDFFGEISIDQRVPATATVVAKTAVRAWVMSDSQFRAVRANEPLLLRLRTAMIERLLANRPAGK
jgi:CRP-like cAMP-binding protein